MTLATHSAEDAAAIRETGRNPRFLSDIDLSDVNATTIAEAPVEDAELIVIALPSRVFGSVVQALPGSAPLLSLTKGLDPETGDRLSTLVSGRPVAVLSGPNMAEEVAAGLPGATVIATEDAAFGQQLQQALNSGVFRVYLNDDLIGVELCAAAKNVIALAAGACDGLGVGDNAKAALITRGLVEMARLGEAAGADSETFSGLAGMGDLIVTCWHPSGRNRRAGELIALGRSARGGGRRDRPGRRRPDDGAGPARPVAPPRRRAPDHRGRLRGARGQPADGARRGADGTQADR